MMKHFYISLIALLQLVPLSGHGFSVDTLVLLADNGWQQINAICHRALKKKVSVASYDTISSFLTTASVIRGGKSTTNCYIRFGFEERSKDLQHHDEVVCTPAQEFYCASQRKWIPAYMLKIGDELFCANNTTKTVAYVSLINQPLDIYTVEVKRTHTFFVTQHSMLTHNMVLPIAFNIGLSIPFGASAIGTVGSFFGPATLVIGAAAGCILGALVKIIYDGQIPCYSVDTYDAAIVEQQVNQQPQIVCDWPSCSIIVQDQPKEKPGCVPGIVEIFENPGCPIITLETPLILITPAEPMPIFQNPGCGAIPDELKEILNKPIVYIAESNADDKVNKVLDGASYVGKSNEGTKIYSKPKGYGDAIKDFEGMELDGVKSIKNDEVSVGSLSDGRKVNVRKTSKGNHKGEDKWPTLEIRSSDGKRSKIKIRYTKANS